MSVEIELAAARLPVPIDWARLFGNDNPVELEVGTGKGRFLIETALANPSVNYLGIERSLKWMRFAMARMRKAGLVNVRMIWTEARHFLDRYVPERSVRAIHVYFPDPWPKRRHEKRRLFGSGIGAALARCLVPGGRLLVATDREDYFAVMVSVLDAEPSLERLHAGPAPAADPPRTHFETKYVAEGRGIHDAEYRKLRCG